MKESFICNSPDDTFELGRAFAARLRAGNVVLLEGGLGAGKTLLTKGIMHGLGYDVDEVTSPSFSLVNLYRTPTFDVYHIDLWRIDPTHDPASAVGLDEILEHPTAVTLIEWADRLSEKLPAHTIMIGLEGDGDGPRSITVEEDISAKI